MKPDTRRITYGACLALGLCVGCSDEIHSAPLSAPANSASVAAADADPGPTLHAMHIGIDDYLEQPLLGAVNDATALSALSKDLDARTNLLLLDAHANRQAIFDGWAQLVRASQAGDVLLVTYAGHGAYIDAQGKSDEADGRDEILVLPGLDSGRKDQVIVDDELALLFAQATDRTVIWVADSCHSGTSSRSAASPELAFPMRSRPVGADLELAPLDEADLQAADFRNVVSLAAVTDDLQVPEILHRGQQRGALSVAFERAVRGRADHTPADGMLGFVELRDEIMAQVRILTNNGQAPQLDSGLKSDQALLRSLALREEPLSMTRVFLANAEGLSPADRGALNLATDQRGADFKWDVASGEIFRLSEGVGKRVAEGVTGTGGMLGEIQRWEALQALQELPRNAAPVLQARASDPALQACLEAGQQCQRGTRLRIAARLEPSPERPYLTLVDLSAQGTVYWYGIGSGRSEISETVEVSAPYGVEHVIAIATIEPLILAAEPKTMGAISGPAAVLEGAQGIAALEILRRLAEGGDARIATLSLYTSAQ